MSHYMQSTCNIIWYVVTATKCKLLVIWENACGNNSFQCGIKSLTLAIKDTWPWLSHLLSLGLFYYFSYNMTEIISTTLTSKGCHRIRDDGCWSLWKPPSPLLIKGLVNMNYLHPDDLINVQSGQCFILRCFAQGIIRKENLPLT